jgi:eukaryotic-like serine/threonine-protein kinase
VDHDGPSLAPGFKLDRYELLSPIAQGGMAEVWMARQLGKHGFEKLVAVKTILPQFADDDRFQRMFLDEARVSSCIQHANVAQTLDVGEQDDITYLVMEYVDGDALSTLHRAAESHGVRIPHGILLRLMVEVCSGLHAAHDVRMANGELAGVVHRDVSPHNILVNTKGTAKLIDFGLAKARDRVADETSAGMVKGKLRYMAPEQIVGPAVDRRADVWAVGATLYHLLSGEPPYEAETDVDVYRALMSGRPPRRLGPAVHPAVEAVVLRALAWHADQRFATAYDFQRALEQAMRATGLDASASQIASFLADHLGDRAQLRQEATARAIEEVASREGALGHARTSAHLALLTPTPVRADMRPRESWSGSGVPAPPSSATPSAISKRSIVAGEPAPRSRSVAQMSAAALASAVVAFAGLGLYFRQARLPTDPPVAATSARQSAIAVRVPSVPAAPARAMPLPEPAAPPAVDSAISMTVNVTDLPMATPAPARAAPRRLSPRNAAAATAPGATAGLDAEAPAETGDEATQDP